MPRSRDHSLLLLIPLAALLAVLPLILHGCSCGHDFDFHLLSWQEAAQQFAHGNLHPRWAFTPAWGAGEPRFVFYPPLSWTLGALLTLAAAALHHLPGLRNLQQAQLFAATPIVYTWLALSLAGLAMHHLARRYVSATPALLVAILYLANPYTLFTAYERTAFAELLAAAWLPLLLAALLPSARNPREPLSIPRTAIPLALLWLTNAPAAVIGSYALALIIALRLLPLLRSRSSRVPHISPLRCGSAGRQIAPTSRQEALALALRATAATALALALAAFYIVPAVLERPWVSIRMAILPGLRPDDNTLFHHTADAAHDAVLRSASHLALLLLTLTTIALVALYLRHRARRGQHPIAPPILSILAFLTAAIAFLLTPASLPLWHHLPELAFLQFPWRLLALLAPICALSVALALTPSQSFPPHHKAVSSRPHPEDVSSQPHHKAVSSRPKAARSAAAVERPAVAPAQLPRTPSPFLPWAFLALAAALILPAYATFHQTCDDEDTPQARYALFRTPTGDEPTDEYTPATADNDSLKDNNPGYRLLPAPANENQPANDDTPPAPDASPGAAPLTLDLDLKSPALLVLNLRDYPTWQVERNGVTLPSTSPDRLRRADGLLALDLPAGPEHLRLTQRTPPPELAAAVLSAAALCLTVAFSVRQRRRRKLAI